MIEILLIIIIPHLRNSVKSEFHEQAIDNNPSLFSTSQRHLNVNSLKSGRNILFLFFKHLYSHREKLGHIEHL